MKKLEQLPGLAKRTRCAPPRRPRCHRKLSDSSRPESDIYRSHHHGPEYQPNWLWLHQESSPARGKHHRHIEYDRRPNGEDLLNSCVPPSPPQVVLPC